MSEKPLAQTMSQMALFNLPTEDYHHLIHASQRLCEALTGPKGVYNQEIDIR